MNQLTMASLFDGSGGFPLASIYAGIKPVWASEVEPFPIRVTTKRLPFMKHYGDVSKIDGAIVEPVDIMTFGSPCQDMSTAGKRAGLDGGRSSLFYQAIRIIEEMRCATHDVYPRFAVWENVPGAFSSNNGRDFRAVLDEFIHVSCPSAPEIPMPENGKWPYADVVLGTGWSIAYRVLDAQYWGVPQLRRRIYLVADFRGQSAPEILFKSEGLSRYSYESFKTWQRVAGSVEERADDTGRNEYITYDGAQVTSPLHADSKVPGPSNCLAAGNAGNIWILRAESNHPPFVFENHSQDSRYTGPLDVAQTVLAAFGTGGNNQPLVVETPKTLKIRSGCDGGGKGSLIQDDKSATLGTNNDQTLFEPKAWDGADVSPTLTANNAGGNQRMPDKDNFNCVVEAYGICSKDSNSMKSENPNSGFYKADSSRTLDGNGGNPTCNQGGIAVVEGIPFTQNQRDEVRTLGDKTGALCKAVTKQQTYILQGSMIGRKDENGPQGDGVDEDVSFTLNTVDRHAVYTMTTGDFTQVCKEKSPTLMARDYKDPPLINDKDGADYIVRRLTPTECARLQGFPDGWCHNLSIKEPTADDLAFWRDVFDTYCRINGIKTKTDKNIIKWLKQPYNETAEYKMWGNGVALPCVAFVMCGIAWAANNERKP